MSEGQGFGELALVQTGKRAATVRSQDAICEFVVIDKQDFQSLLEGNYKREIDRKMGLM